MCNPFQAVAKVFKAVVGSTIGKIAIAVGIGFLTMGIGSAILGAAELGLSATMTSILGGAIDGVLAGGLTSALTGGNIGKGALFGGIGGAAFGGAKALLGVSSGQGPIADMIAGDPASQAANAVQAVGTTQPGAIADPFDEIAGGFQQQGSPGANLPAGSIINNPPPLPRPRPDDLVTSQNNGLLGGVGDFINKNPALAMAGGSAIAQGLGSGLLAKGAADATENATAQKIQAEQAATDSIRASHEGLTLPQLGATDTTPRPTPAQRFNPDNYRQGNWVYDPSVGRIMFVRAQTA